MSLRNILLLSALLVAATGCKKYLDAKPNKKMVIVSTIEDLQALLDHDYVINSYDPAEGEISSDNYYLTDDGWSAIYYEEDRRLYTWEKDRVIRPGATAGNNWGAIYNKIYRANNILEEIDGISLVPAREDERRNVKGQAFFVRGLSFLQAAEIWTLAYDERSAKTDLGIPLRKSTDFNEVSTRASVQETYDQIISDLKYAAALLPITPLHVVRASKPAAFGILARTFLNMRKYDQAKLYADSCLQLYGQLLDYSSLKPADPYPFVMSNKEVIYEGLKSASSEEPMGIKNARVKEELYHSYVENDLRKQLFFLTNKDGSYAFKGNYSGGSSLWMGLATDEVYLIRAECQARADNVSGALKDLNFLLKTRWAKNSFTDFTAQNSEDALLLILTERRKELLMRGRRWMDLKRLNKEGANIAQQRVIKGVTYTLPANDLRYALPIPEDVIELSGMPQNPR